MTREEFLLLIDELLELDPGSLKGPEKLAELENWDSLSIVSFMGLARARLDRTVSAKEIAACECVGDLYTLARSQTPS